MKHIGIKNGDEQALKNPNGQFLSQRGRYVLVRPARLRRAELTTTSHTTG